MRQFNSFYLARWTPLSQAHFVYRNMHYASLISTTRVHMTRTHCSEGILHTGGVWGHRFPSLFHTLPVRLCLTTSFPWSLHDKSKLVLGYLSCYKMGTSQLLPRGYEPWSLPTKHFTYLNCHRVFERLHSSLAHLTNDSRGWTRGESDAHELFYT